MVVRPQQGKLVNPLIRRKDLEEWTREGGAATPALLPFEPSGRTPTAVQKGLAIQRLRSQGLRVSWEQVHRLEDGEASLWKPGVQPRHLGPLEGRRSALAGWREGHRPKGAGRFFQGEREFRVKDPERPIRGSASEVGTLHKPLVGCSILCSGNNTIRTLWHTKRRASPLVRERGKTGQVRELRKATHQGSWFGVENIYRNRPGSKSVIAARGQRQPLVRVSAGRRGRSGARRGTTYAAESVGRERARRCLEVQRRVLHLVLEGKRAHLTSAVRGLRAGGVTIASLRYVVKTPHGGCRPKKARRL